MNSRLVRCESRVRLGAGFTLIELLVAIAIVGIVVGLTLPAVQNVRETSRRVQCGNQIRQLGLGAQLFHNQYRHLPGNGGWAVDNHIVGVDGAPVTPFTRDFSADRVVMWGVADPERQSEDQTGPWCFSLLPFVELKPLWVPNHYVNEVGIFRCPSRSRGGVALPPVTDLYGDYESGGHAMAKTDYAANLFVALGRPDVMTFKGLQDGTQYTIMYGEKAFNPVVQTVGSWYWDEPIYIGGSQGTSRGFGKIVDDHPESEFRENWGSAHGGLSHFVFADGHVDTLSHSIDERAFQHLLTPDKRDN